MHARARRLLRPRAAEVVEAIPDPFVQVVRDACTSRRLSGRLALIGDAAAVARPHTGAGALKATSEAMVLGNALRKFADLDTAFRAWAEETHPRSQETYRLGRALGCALVLETPEWDVFDEEMLLDYWNSATAGGRPHYIDVRRVKEQPVASRHSK
jgi:2-polyprenyl-6-methoxyphenol hydroxylase-like FAD-dependent oxidoreductase